MQLLIQCARSLAQQNCQSVARLFLGRLERWNRGLSRLQARTAALHVELRAAARLIEELREVERLMLGAQVLPRHRETLLGASQFEIITRHLRSDGNLRVLIVCPLSPQVSPGGLDRTADMTEEIDLPRRVKPQAVALCIDSGRTKSRLLLIKVRVRTLYLHVWCIVEFSLHEYGARCADSIVRGTQIQIGCQRAAHQLVEFGVAKLLPPKRLGGLRDELGGLGVLHSSRGNLRCVVGGPDSAGGQKKSRH